MPNGEIGIHIRVEGSLDEAIVSKMVLKHRINILDIRHYPKKEMQKKIPGFNEQARTAPWLILVDLDIDDFSCAPELRSVWLPNPANFMCFRVAKNEIESWILADRERFSKFFTLKITG